MEKILKGPRIKNLPEVQTLGEFVFKSAQKHGSQIFQIDAATGQSETYSSMKTRTVRLALYLQSHGITSNDVVIISSKNNINCAIPIISAFYLGAKVGFFDPTLSVRQTKHLLSLTNPKIVFVDNTTTLDLIQKSLTNHETKTILFEDSGEHQHLSQILKEPNDYQQEEEFQPCKVDENKIGYMICSSGTTGLSKVICHSHRSLLNLITSFSFRETGLDYRCIFHMSSFFWVSAIIVMLSSTRTGGCRIFTTLDDPKHFFEIVEKYKITLAFFAPILTYNLTSFQEAKKYDTSSLAQVLLAGTAVSKEQIERLGNVFKSSAILNGYGMSELGFTTIFHPKLDKHHRTTKLTSCGKLSPGITAKVINTASGKLLGPEERGELRFKSESLMLGYYNSPEETVEAFDNDNFLKSGDIGYYDKDGCFYFVERTKEMFKYLSWHIVPSAIEQVLLEHPGVSDAAVFGTPSSEEEEGEVPTACVVLHQNADVNEEEIKKFVAERVSDREKLRGGVIFARELLKTPSGKLKRREIREKYVKKAIYEKL